MPLILGVQPLGVLTIVSRRTDAFEPGHISAMRLMVGLVVAALSHASEFEIKQKLLATADEIRTLDMAETLAAISIEHHNTIGQLGYLIRHDSLTGLPNRIMAEDRLGQALALARRSNRLVAVMILDVDHFKSINDTLGHHAGDSLLQQFSDRFNRPLRETDTMARIGGDEFVVMLPELAHHDEAAIVARKLLDTLADPFEVGEHRIQVTCSIGITLFPDDGDDALTLQKQADAALYRAKKQGRDRFAF